MTIIILIWGMIREMGSEDLLGEDDFTGE